MRLFCISPHFQQSIMGGAERWEDDYKLQWGGNKLWQSIYINSRIQWEKTNKQQIQITITNTNYNGEETNDLHQGVY